MGKIKRFLGFQTEEIDTLIEDVLTNELAETVERNKAAATNLQHAALSQVSDGEIVRQTVEKALQRIEQRSMPR